MLKYKENRKLITFTCDNCGCEATKPESEYKRNLRLGRHNFCSRKCSVLYANKHNLNHSSDWRNSEEGKRHIASYSGNRRTDHTPFNYTLRNARKRYKDFNLTAEYLKDVWDNQQGKCPYTGISLILPTFKHNKDIPIASRASLDRIDSTKGYIIGNVQFISTPINYLKNTMTDLETKQYLKLISQYTSNFH